ncbi:MAG: 4Fe-4S dicluster domain-containing protein [Actinobacteria bacterium]|nr:4Fe-4S dicluster domain-containing protein [Actinomycetota bacterium]
MRNLRPSQWTLIAGSLLGIAVVGGSGLAAAIFQQHHDSPISRTVFVNVPGALQLVFYVSLAVLFIAMSWLFARRVRAWEMGGPESRPLRTKTKRRMTDLRRGLYMQTLLRDPAAGVMHSLIYFPFLILFAVTTVLEIDHQLPAGMKFLHGTTYQAYSAVGDLAGVAFMAGIVWAIVRRYVHRPYRLRIKTRPEDHLILFTFAAIGVTGFVTEAMRIALVERPEFERWSVVGYPMSELFQGWSGLEQWHQVFWIAHFAAFGAFLIILPSTKLRHMVTSPLNMYLSARERPKGAMKPMPNLEETSLESFGAAAVTDFTWKQLLDTDACTICGRCTSVCPAHATGKSLDPREIVLKVGNVMAASAPGGPVSPVIGQDAEITISTDSVFERITAEEIWACTSCKACDEICPVNIEILDKILDMRRYLSLMESDFPSELGNAYRSMETSENPWGMPQGSRGDWTAALPAEVPVVGADGPFDHEYLYWVGCAGSFDDKAKKVTVATAKLLHRAGVDFAILGPQERCTGDPARRSGNEYLFQQLAGQNVETLNGMGVRKILAHCPHCFNTLKNEYKDFGIELEVVHHTQLLNRLVREGRLTPVADGAGAAKRSITYHDPCYLGRHYQVYSPPRELLQVLPGAEYKEMERHSEKSFCCGAGGARMWMEEQTGTKVNTERAREAIATGADRVATACPFCLVMLDDGVKEHGRDDVIVQDISVHLLESLENADAARSGNGNGNEPQPGEPVAVAATPGGAETHQPHEHGADEGGVAPG